MSAKQFYIGLFLTVGLCILCVAAMYALRPELSQVDFTSFLVTIMVGLSIVMYKSAVSAAQNPNPYVYSQRFLAFTGLKIFLCIGVIIMYKVLFPEQPTSFLFSFLIVYVWFTIFETYVFMKLSKG